MKALVLLWALSGCGAVLCSFTGNAIGHCPALKAAAAENQANTAPESSESSSESSEASESKSETKTEEAAPAKTNCRASGATCEQSYQCCSDACVTHSPDNYCR